MIRNIFQEEKLSAMRGTGPRGGKKWEFHMVLQNKSWPTPSRGTWYGDVGSGQAGAFGPAMPHPSTVLLGADGCTPFLMLSFSAGALHSTGRGDLGARTPSHLFISCVREGAIFGL